MPEANNCKAKNTPCMRHAFNKLTPTLTQKIRPNAKPKRIKKMLKMGLEPIRLAAYEPESYVSTNFTT